MSGKVFGIVVLLAAAVSTLSTAAGSEGRSSVARSCDVALVDALARHQPLDSFLPSGFFASAPARLLPHPLHASGHVGTEVGVEKQSPSLKPDPNFLANIEFDVFRTRTGAITLWHRLIDPLSRSSGVAAKPAPGLPQPAVRLRLSRTMTYDLATVKRVIVSTMTDLRSKPELHLADTTMRLERVGLAYLRARVLAVHLARPACPRAL